MITKLNGDYERGYRKALLDLSIFLEKNNMVEPSDGSTSVLGIKSLKTHKRILSELMKTLINNTDKNREFFQMYGGNVALCVKYREKLEAKNIRGVSFEDLVDEKKIVYDE